MPWQAVVAPLIVVGANDATMNILVKVLHCRVLIKGRVWSRASAACLPAYYFICVHT